LALQDSDSGARGNLTKLTQKNEFHSLLKRLLYLSKMLLYPSKRFFLIFFLSKKLIFKTIVYKKKLLTAAAIRTPAPHKISLKYFSLIAKGGIPSLGIRIRIQFFEGIAVFGSIPYKMITDP
jgi:hypothetical protein